MDTNRVGNPARPLLATLERWHSSGVAPLQTRDLDTPEAVAETAEALRNLDAVTRRLSLLEARGADVAEYRAASHSWLRGIFHYRQSWESAADDIPRIDMLRALVPLLDVTAPALTADQVEDLEENVSRLLDDVIQALAADTDLDDTLRSYIFDAVSHVRTCVDRFEVTGVFDLGRAIKELELLLAAAQTLSPTHQSLWEKARKGFSGFTSNPTTAAIAGAAGAGVAGLLTT